MVMYTVRLKPEKYKQHLSLKILRHRTQWIDVTSSQTAQQKYEGGDCMDVLVYSQENERTSKR